MRHFLQIFFGLLIPLTALFIAVSTGYYMLEYPFSKAIKLAILSGVVLGFSITFFLSIILLIMRAGTQSNAPARKTKKTHKKPVAIKTSYDQEASNKLPMGEFITQNFMLLMDKTLAFEISKYAIESQKINKQGLHENFENGLISIKTIHEFIKINISSLTKHTVKISIEYKRNSLQAPLILKFLKEKEVSFLDYK
jgi:hypothetical protein